MQREIALSDEVDSDLADDQDKQAEQDDDECETENDEEYRSRLIRLRSDWYAAQDRGSNSEYSLFKSTLYLPNSIIQKEDSNDSSDSDFSVDEDASGDEEVIEEAAALARTRASQPKKRKKNFHVANIRSQNFEESTLRSALELAISTLRAHNVTVPDQLAKFATTPVGSTSIAPTEPLCSFRMTNLVTPTNCKSNNLQTWPHEYGFYRPDGELAAIIEARKNQKLTFKIVGGTFKSEHTVQFCLNLVYDDSDEIIFTSRAEPMRDRSVEFKLNFPRVLSSSTTPRHRRFRYDLNCLEPYLVIPAVKLPSFFAVSKLKRESS